MCLFIFTFQGLAHHGHGDYQLGDARQKDLRLFKNADAQVMPKPYAIRRLWHGAQASVVLRH